jgi:hypothetical protein
MADAAGNFGALARSRFGSKIGVPLAVSEAGKLW